MLKETPHFTLNFKFIGLFLLFFGLFSTLSFAQGEREKVILEDPVEEKSITKTSSKELNALAPNKKAVDKTSTAVAKESTLQRKNVEGGIIEDPKAKKEEVSSTLSFNLFLYIVDKFKAD